MSTFIALAVPSWLLWLAAVLGLAATLAWLRAYLHLRARKREWLAEHHPTTLDFTCLAGVHLPGAARAVSERARVAAPAAPGASITASDQGATGHDASGHGVSCNDASGHGASCDGASGAGPAGGSAG